METGIDINHNIINWAIARAGYNEIDFFSQFPKIKEWMQNGKKLTLKQLEIISNKLHVPFGYLLLKTPPIEKLPIPYFRTINSNKNINLNVFDTILSIKRRQEWLIEYLDENKFEQLDFIGKFNINDNIEVVIKDIKETIGIEDGWASQFKTWEEALLFLTAKIEELGIIIVFNGVVENNTHRPISVEDCRGFVMVDKLAPFLFVNSSDGKAAQMFTIIHELVHLWLGESAGFENNKLLPANDPIEIFCDKVAAELLVPTKLFIELWKKTQNFKNLSKHFKVSLIVIARRALDLQLISKKDFFIFYEAYLNDIKNKKIKTSSGGDFFATQKRRLNVRFASHVDRAVKENKLLFRDAYKITGLKGDTYQKFMTKHLY